MNRNQENKLDCISRRAFCLIPGCLSQGDIKAMLRFPGKFCFLEYLCITSLLFLMKFLRIKNLFI